MVIGITGGIGSGKTLVCNIFSTLGLPVYHSDDRAKWLMNHSTLLREQIIDEFGGKCYSNNQLNRRALAAVVFNNKERLQLLNSMVHPAVEADFNHWNLQHPNAPYSIKEAAILFESGAYKSVDKTILVIAPKEERIKRVCERDNCSKKDVQARMNNQWTTEKLLSLTDYTINNSGKTLILPQILELDKLFRQ